MVEHIRQLVVAFGSRVGRTDGVRRRWSGRRYRRNQAAAARGVHRQPPQQLPDSERTRCGGVVQHDDRAIVSLNNNFFTPQGTNGRDCGTCHAAEDGWSLKPSTVTLMFLLSDGLDPLFVNHLDTDTPTCDMSTTQARWNCTTMLRQGLFTRRVAPPATRDYDVIAAADPLGVGTTASLWFFRRPLPTANFKSHTVMWDGGEHRRDVAA